MNENRILETLPSVQRLARLFSTRYRADADELVSVGHEAVVHADRDFDASRGVTFRAFAWMRAKYAMLEHVRREAIRRRRSSLSLDWPSSARGEPMWAQLLDERSTEVLFDARALLQLLAGLPAREREVVTRHVRGESEHEIASALGISRGRAWQLKAQAVYRLRAAA
jgi:RNA polymerase sigma factor (sigma-70 family)